MPMVLEHDPDVGNAASLRRELLAAGFLIEACGDGARLVLSTSLGSDTYSPAPTPVDRNMPPVS